MFEDVDMERLNKLVEMLKDPKEQDILTLAQVFYSSTVLSKAVPWKDLFEKSPEKTLFFTGGVARVVMYLKMEVLGFGRKSTDSDNKAEGVEKDDTAGTDADRAGGDVS